MGLADSEIVFFGVDLGYIVGYLYFVICLGGTIRADLVIDLLGRREFSGSKGWLGEEDSGEE